MVLTPELILQAYQAGIFPMAADRKSAEILWYDPDMRGILPIKDLHVPKRLQRTIKKQPYQITFNQAFNEVIRGCAETRAETWINDDIIAVYTALHQKGFTHSVEAWQGTRLVGGVYGLALGGAFFGESMFSTATDASKIALVHLTARLWRQGFELLDTQFINDHLKQFGVYEVSWADYHRHLKKALMKKASFNKPQSSKSVVGSGSSLTAGSSPSSLTGAPSGAFSEEKSCDFDDVVSFLQSITHTS